MALSFSAALHLGLATLMVVHVSALPDPGDVTYGDVTYAVDLVHRPAPTPVPELVVAPLPPLLVGRVGQPSGREAVVASLAVSTDRGTAAGIDRAAPSEALVAGDDTLPLHRRLQTHPALDLPVEQPRPARHLTPRPDRATPEDEEPTPFMAPGSSAPDQPRLAQAPGGDRPVERTARAARDEQQLSRIPLTGALPDRPPTRTRPAPGAIASRRLPDLMDAARPQDHGADSGRGRGSRSRRQGAASGSDGRFVWLSTPDMRYVDYFRHIYRKVQPLWLFPKKLEILLEQGDVLVQFTIQSDGSVQDVRVRKSSGYREFDRNVVAAIEKATPFRPIPVGLGERLHVLAPFEFANPMVR